MRPWCWMLSAVNYAIKCRGLSSSCVGFWRMMWWHCLVTATIIPLVGLLCIAEYFSTHCAFSFRPVDNIWAIIALPNISAKAKAITSTHCAFSFRPVDNIWAMMIVWRIRGKIVRTVLCCIVYDSYCTQWYAHTYEQFLKLSVDFRFRYICVCFVYLL